jgi:hypothetical protein
MKAVILAMLLPLLASVALAEETNKPAPAAVASNAASTSATSNALPATITIDGTTYEDVRWERVTRATVTIFHKTGVASIPLEKLPSELQQRFGYDPQKAAEYRAADAVAQAHRAERIAEMQAAQARLDQQQALEQEEMTRRSQQQPANQISSSLPVQLEFSTVEFQPPSNGVGRASLKLAGGEKTSVFFDAKGESFLNRCLAQHASWQQQVASAEQAKQNNAQPNSTPLWANDPNVSGRFTPHLINVLTPGSDTSYSIPMPTFVVYAQQIDGSTYKLVGIHKTVRMGGSEEYSW